MHALNQYLAVQNGGDNGVLVTTPQQRVEAATIHGLQSMERVLHQDHINAHMVSIADINDTNENEGHKQERQPRW